MRKLNQNSLPVFTCVRLPAPSAGPSPAVSECNWHTNKSLWLVLSITDEDCQVKAFIGGGQNPMWQQQRVPAFTSASLAHTKKHQPTGPSSASKNGEASVSHREGSGRLFWYDWGWAVMRNGSRDRRQATLLCSEREDSTARPLTEHVLYGSVSLLECTWLQAQIPRHIRAVLVAIWLSSIMTSIFMVAWIIYAYWEILRYINTSQVHLGKTLVMVGSKTHGQ